MDNYFDDRYEVLDGAQGGMGCVLFCRDRETSQPVAVKLCADTGKPQLFLEEARKWIRLGEHPHIVRALYAGRSAAAVKRLDSSVGGRPIRYLIPSFSGDAGSQRPADDKVYIVLELIAKSTRTGCSLRNWLDDTPRIPSGAILRWAFQVAGALEYSSVQHGLIHQDIKPDNILITPSGDAKLTDFGVASRIGTDKLVGGTPVYMAPEHRAGQPSVRSDIYSFGMTLAECFLGHIPSRNRALANDGGLSALSEEQLALLMCEGRPAEEPRPQRLCEALARMVKICTNADPTGRYAGFEELRHALAEVARTHLGLQLGASEAKLAAEAEAADMTNRALALLNLGGIDGGTELLLQATVRSPDNPVAREALRKRFLLALSEGFLKRATGSPVPLLGPAGYRDRISAWLRGSQPRQNSRQVLRLAWSHVKLSLRTLRGWSRLLAGVAVLALLLYYSSESGVTKVSVAVLASVLAVEAYVNLSLAVVAELAAHHDRRGVGPAAFRSLVLVSDSPAVE